MQLIASRCSASLKIATRKPYTDAEVLSRVTIRRIEPQKKKSRLDVLIRERHYLGNAHRVGRQLRYVAELDSEWVALLGWNAAAYHRKGREQGIGVERPAVTQVSQVPRTVAFCC